jgi:N-acetylglucosaminyldiphosphoundecaprenol N-acetyl-beta-D-mannosaminyltransferase
MLPIVHLQGLRFAAVRETEAAAHVVKQAAAGIGGWVVTPNLDILRQCARNPKLADMVATADLIVPDGMPLIWASRVQRTPLPARVAGSNLVPLVSELAAKKGLSIFLLGGNTGSAERAASVLEQRYPRLKVAGTFCPPFGFERDPEKFPQIREALRAARPDIVFVGLGFPKQEKLIEALRGDLPDAWWLGVGVSFSFVAGEIGRAPGWMQRSGLEWLHRLGQEPRRLAKRYLVDDIPFAFELAARSVQQRYTKARVPAEAA